MFLSLLFIWTYTSKIHSILLCSSLLDPIMFHLDTNITNSSTVWHIFCWLSKAWNLIIYTVFPELSLISIVTQLFVPEKSLMKAKGRSTVFKEWNFHLCKWAELQRNVAADLELNNTRLLQCAKFPKHLDFPRSAASEIVLPIFSFASLKYNK